MKIFKNRIAVNLDGTVEVSVNGFIAPVEYSAGDFHKRWGALANLRVAEPEMQYSASVFRAFLPSGAVSAGEVWRIEEAGSLALLRQLHPNPHLDLHHDVGDSCGLWACLRAYNDQLAHVVFRIHAEFALTDGWFTPSQFAGHLVIDRNEDKIVFFQMRVPEGVMNFDANWHTTEEGWRPDTIINDTGFCPQMELRAGIEPDVQNLEFIEAITEEEAAHKLILCFYESEQIHWVPLDEALEIAQVQQKHVHAISVDGPLADESC